jgi:hypothetical protein
MSDICGPARDALNELHPGLIDDEREVLEGEPVSDEEWNRLHAHQDVRNTDPDTSHSAARTANRGEVRERVLKLFQEFKRLPDERLLAKYIARYGAIPESSPRKRRCDLVKLGKVRDSGIRVLISTGKMAILWELVEEKKNGSEE